MKFRCLPVICLLILSSIVRADADGSFGRTELSGTIAADIENYMKGGIFFCNGDGAADSIRVFLEIQSNSAAVRCAIYQRTSGTAWQLIDSSAEHICGVDTAWYTFPLIERTTVSAGGQYALVAWARQSAAWNCRIHSLEGQGEAADSMFFKSTTYGAWPSPTVPTLVWYYDAVFVCYYSGAAAVHHPAAVDGGVNKGAYLQ